ncbi:polyprenyl synthetase family protein [Sphingomonas cavernae]|uniref:Polyprenyl synthetase family protein n=1 Tax=Sphingomonas cavernae TaxID=2320861 RepID=A0A418WKN5_9SPHN|nr:farnesyl diphosphate synthase [Sphingomonas cavernae]RJF90601.1 polyprenyl synthetase family protein [Sphingomonas cavernae]
MICSSSTTLDLTVAFGRVRLEVDDLLDRLIVVPDDDRAVLFHAMRYAVMGGGKRLRPLLVTATCELFGGSRSQALLVGAAAECVHAQSLAHDDLPCMDDDDLRRGKPSVHNAFGEAVAVLAGDALLAFAFELLGRRDVHDDGSVRAELVRSLAEAVGAAGMAGGQVMDLVATQGVDAAEIAKMQELKTAALIGWCAEAGASLAGIPAEARASLTRYATSLGLAFQIVDDLLDIEGIPLRTGKRLGRDKAAGRHNLVTILGRDEARALASSTANQAIDCLGQFGERANLLRDLARFSVLRDH